MSNFYKWYSVIDIVECYSFKACYQLISKMKKHGFKVAFTTKTGNNIIFSMIKNETCIAVFVTHSVYDELNHKTITYNDYVRSIERG